MSERTELQKARAAHKRAHARLAVLWKPIPKARERCEAALTRLKRAERIESLAARILRGEIPTPAEMEEIR